MRVADETGRRGVDHLDLGNVDALLFGEEFRHHEIRGRAGGGELLAFQILDRLDRRPRGDDGAPEVEQVEQILHLDAAGVGEADGQHCGAAADLELAGIELRGVGVGRPLDEFDIEAVLLIDLLGLDHRRHEGAERGEAEHDDGDFGRRLRGGGRGRRQRRDGERSGAQRPCAAMRTILSSCSSSKFFVQCGPFGLCSCH